MTRKVSNTPTFATLPPISARSVIRICRVVGVALRTMGFSVIQCRRALASPQILLPSHRLKVGRVDAVPNSAEMVQVQAFRDGANEGFVGIPMSRNPIRPEAKAAVPLRGFGPGPKPAGISLFDFSPKALISLLFDSTPRWVSVPFEPRVVHKAEGVTRRPLSAAVDGTWLIHSRMIAAEA